MSATMQELRAREQLAIGECVLLDTGFTIYRYRKPFHNGFMADLEGTYIVSMPDPDTVGGTLWLSATDGSWASGGSGEWFRSAHFPDLETAIDHLWAAINAPTDASKSPRRPSGKTLEDFAQELLYGREF
jgi:hypothetical protein